MASGPLSSARWLTLLALLHLWPTLSEAREASRPLSGLIARAKTSIYIAARNLRDRDLARSLTLARYRKVRVGVVLAPTSRKDALSVYAPLRASRVPVAVADTSFLGRRSLVVLVDGKPYSSSAKAPSAATVLRSQRKNAASLALARLAKTRFTKASKPIALKAPTRTPKAAAAGSRPYRYDRKRLKRDPKIASRLPRWPSWHGKKKN